MAYSPRLNQKEPIMASNAPFLPAHLRDALALRRVADDLRRHVPIVIDTPEQGAATLVFAAELIEPDMLAGLRQLGVPRLLITRERAAALKIRHKGRDVVALDIPAAMTAATLRAVADATRDLATPLKGPFTAIDGAAGEAGSAALALLRAARLLPAALAVRLPEGRTLPDLLRIEAGSVPQAAANDHRLDEVARAGLPIEGAPSARIVAFRPAAGGVEHFAILVGNPQPSDAVLVRLHSECFTGDMLGSLKCDCGSQLRGALAAIVGAGSGILLYLAQEGRGIGLVAKLKAYALQDQGFDTVDANLRLGFAVDEREFAPAAAMLRALGCKQVRLLTNNPEKVRGLEGQGISVVERVAHSFPANEHNRHYLAVKRDRSGHLL